MKMMTRGDKLALVGWLIAGAVFTWVVYTVFW
jgi:hypothetical protein